LFCKIYAWKKLGKVSNHPTMGENSPNVVVTLAGSGPNNFELKYVCADEVIICFDMKKLS
jgi:hypothetical protein